MAIFNSYVSLPEAIFWAKQCDFPLNNQGLNEEMEVDMGGVASPIRIPKGTSNKSTMASWGY